MKTNLNFSELLKEAVEKPGIVSSAYRSFYNYSVGNQILAYVQCLCRGITPGPIATYKAWQEKGRQVMKGQKAISLVMPVTMKRDKVDDETGEVEKVPFTRFIMKNNWFVLEQTDGDDYAAEPVPGYDVERALNELDIKEIPFDVTNGNIGGFAFKNEISVNPMNSLAAKTRFHEMAHVVLGHTEERKEDTEELDRHIEEVEAESVAYLCISTLELPGAEESRGYIQTWMTTKEVPEKSAQRIFKAADTILKAGRIAA